MNQSDGYAGNCGVCRKRWWASRAAAKAAGRRKHPGDQLRPYRCPVDGRYWHNGHLATTVTSGGATRAEIYGREAA